MKRTLLTLGLFLFAAPAWATCGVSNLQVKDNLGTTAAVPYADDGAGASNCSPQVQIKQGGNVVAVTAGSALKVDGSAVTQPVSGAVTANQGTANATPWNENLAQMGGTAINSACVAALSGFSSSIPSTVCGVFGTYVLNANTNVGNNSDAVTAGGSAGSPVVNYNYGFNGTTWDRLQVDGSKNLKVTAINGGTFAVQSTNQASTNRIGYTSDDPCTQKVKINVPIATSSGNVQLVAPSGSTKVYICSAHIVGATAWVGNVIEGTGAACTTSNEAAVWGSTTAASGDSFAANSGISYGNGGGTIGVTATAGNGICLLQSGTAALSGNITYVQQ